MISALSSKIMFVGEFLSAEDENSSSILSGREGYLFEKMLKSADLSRNGHPVTNVFMKRPKNNVVDHFFLKKAEAKRQGLNSPYPSFGTRGSLRPDLEGELARLKSEILEAKPTVIVALGATALWALTGETKISQMRGVILPCTLVPGKKVIGTYAPSAVIREYSGRPVVIADFLKAQEESKFPEIRRKSRSIWIAEKVSDLAIFERLHLEKAFSFATDTETQAAQITHISIAPTDQVALVIPIWEHGISYWSKEDELAIRMWLHRILGDPRWEKRFQNALYDATYFAEEGYNLRGVCQDVMLVHHSLQPELPKSLGFLGSLYCNESGWKTMRVKSIKDTTKKDE